MDNDNLSNFNSIKVRLEPRIDIKGIGNYPNFNSIKVRLERSKTIAAINAREFQFHKGAIRTG